MDVPGSDELVDVPGSDELVDVPGSDELAFSSNLFIYQTFFLLCSGIMDITLFYKL